MDQGRPTVNGDGDPPRTPDSNDADPATHTNESARVPGSSGSRRNLLRSGSSVGRSVSNLVTLLKDAMPARRQKQLGSRWQCLPEMHIPPWLKTRMTYYRLHFACFFIVAIIATFVLWLTPGGPEGPIQFIDAMFVATSATTVTGLITVKMAVLSTFDKVFIMCLLLVGNQVFTSLVPVYVRRFYFVKYLERKRMEQEQEGREEERQLEGIEDGVVSESNGAGLPMSPVQEKAEHSFTNPSRSYADTSVTSDTQPGGDTLVHSSSSNSLRDPVASWQTLDTDADPGSLSARRAGPATPGRRGAWLFEEGITPDTRAANEERTTQTWAGDTAKSNAERLKHILDSLKKEHTPSRAMFRTLSSLSLEYREDGSVDNLKLLPVQRRFIELRALELLCWLVPVYILSIILLAFAFFYIIISTSSYYRNLLAANGVSIFFQSLFQAVTGFTNAGFSLFDDNLISFQADVPYVLLVALLILVGNTMYAPCLRGILVLIRRFGRWEELKLVAKYLLDHPRKCYTHLYPSKPTIWLVLTVLAFNLTEFVFFCALDWNSAALDGLSSGVKVLDGVFQSISTRNAGFNVIPIGLLSPGMLFLYCGMMYVAVYPVYITRQRSREQREVYDDEDIGVFYEDVQEGVLDNSVLAQGKKLVAKDSVLIFIAIFIICIIQAGDIQTDPGFSIFNVIFEVISAYGNVGLSLGYTCTPPTPDATCESPPYSFSGVWKPGAKLILIFVIFLGRQRGLPDNIDAAIVIPEEKHFSTSKPKAGTKDETEVLLNMPPTPNAQPSDVLRRFTMMAQSQQPAELTVRTQSGSNVVEAPS